MPATHPPHSSREAVGLKWRRMHIVTVIHMSSVCLSRSTSKRNYSGPIRGKCRGLQKRLCAALFEHPIKRRPQHTPVQIASEPVDDLSTGIDQKR